MGWGKGELLGVFKIISYQNIAHKYLSQEKNSDKKISETKINTNRYKQISDKKIWTINMNKMLC